MSNENKVEKKPVINAQMVDVGALYKRLQEVFLEKHNLFHDNGDLQSQLSTVTRELEEATQRISELKELLKIETKGHADAWNKQRFLEAKLSVSEKETQLVKALENQRDDLLKQLDALKKPRDQWCAYCGVMGNHTSGNCELLKAHDEIKNLNTKLVETSSKLVVAEKERDEARASCVVMRRVLVNLYPKCICGENGEQIHNDSCARQFMLEDEKQKALSITSGKELLEELGRLRNQLILKNSLPKIVPDWKWRHDELKKEHATLKSSLEKAELLMDDSQDFVASFAHRHPKFVDHAGYEHDPCGAHKWLEDYKEFMKDDAQTRDSIQSKEALLKEGVK